MMNPDPFMYQPLLETLPRALLREHQFARLNALLAQVLSKNRFYQARFGLLRLPLDWETFVTLPLTTKADLVADQELAPPLGHIATCDPGDYVAYHQTSGTTGQPLMVLDTQESWDWWAECWQYVYHAAGVTSADRIFFAFSFGPFIGFWSAHAAARRLGALSIPGGGLDSRARLDLMRRAGATILVSTVTYALRLAAVARDTDFPLEDLPIRGTIHAGEPGASIPAVRARIEAAWGAACFDHAGGTEVGAYGFSCSARDGLHVNEAEFIAEVLDPRSGRPVGDGETGELVITNLGRAGWPVIRYRTGDLVTPSRHACPCGRTFLKLAGGLAGRVDDLMILRGVNVYPSAIEAIVHTYPVDEFRIVRLRGRESDEEILVEVEAPPEVPAALAATLRRQLAVRIATRVVPPGTLPRWELKARRIVDKRDDPAAYASLLDVRADE